MAAFDPIEFFGVGHSRDIAITRHARTGSQNSINLSSVGSPPRVALERRQVDTRLAGDGPLGLTLFSSALENLRPTGSQSSRSPKSPRSPSHAFADITPEDSLYGPTSDLSDTPAVSPNVSNNSSWASNPDQPFSVGRYIRNHERHEVVLLALSAGHQFLKQCRPQALHTLPPSNGLEDDDEGFGASEDDEGFEPLPKDDPIHRYVTDVQPHEQLALALERPDQKESPPQHTDSTTPGHKTSSSISLSAGQVVEEEEEEDDMALIAGVARKYRELRTRRALVAWTQPRLQKRPRGKRHHESPPQGHRDKKARWG
ncbi:hypothetical protein C8A01DRAFT_50787 [Parachaetomium inaequale]|uniref:Uncharacterized protein n=1 Tax=Parachaetomium inaequale TaxID=2588326 RepID=A0AAN6P608_9PEZI|nr:hypothetical protein C8A01DRAFT_50787 [Parachaetomium inaequale]